MSQVRAAHQKIKIAPRYARAAYNGLPALQKLEAQGFLPYTEELEPCASKIRPHLARPIMYTITKILVKRNDKEALQWLQEGGYTLNKRVLTGTAYRHNSELSEWLRERDLLDEGLWMELEKTPQEKSETWSEM